MADPRDARGRGPAPGAEAAREREKARRRLRGRNVALLIALIAFVALIYMVSMVRMRAGVEAGLEEERRQAETPAQVEERVEEGNGQ
jgi:hypothetical protein